MNKIYGLIVFFICIQMIGLAQDAPYQKGIEPVALTADELFVLSNIPELKLPESYKGDAAPLLPTSVDNSSQPYFRPITWQSGYECGQSTGIAFNFCYEIDRLRNVPANTAANQYPTHFAWDFLNNANNYQGASFFDSWEIVRVCGNMNVADYGGGLNTGGYTRWISGYDVYYNGMHNRLNNVKAIRVDTPEGIQTLKYWLFDHLEGSTVGGVGSIYAQYFGPPVATFAAGTPEAGKYVQTNWGGSPSHGWTICGYNDSIRFDFNGDGQYTNNIDLNGDGILDVHDWEKGGVKFANGYAGTGWCNSGFCYTMYKNLADNIGFGGIWNHSIYVLDVKPTCTPKLTMKVTLKHTSRNKLKVTAGVNPDASATVPSYTMELPIFNYQGGDLFMQGGSTEADKTIEFGLDLAPLISQIPGSQAAKFFLQVQENDPSGTATGEIVNWSLIDYTGSTPVVITCPGTNVPLLNNSLTRLSHNYTLFISKPNINNATLPPAQLYQPYSVTLAASGGTPPYRYDAKLDYTELSNTASFPAVTAQPLVLTNNNTGYAVKDLGFQFPFYKKMISKLYIYADGYIVFDDQPYTYPYLIDKNLLFRQTPIISPFMSDLAVYPSLSQGIWYEGNANYAIIRWKASVYNMQGSTTLNFAVKLYPNGNIEYYYGDMTFPAGTGWTGGLSSGDNKNFQYSALNNAPAITTNTLDKFLSCGFPPEMEISEVGIFSGTPTHSYQNIPVKFVVTDNDNISNIKTLTFSSFGLMVTQEIISGGDSLIEFGETANITLHLNNIGTQTFNQLTFSISNTDPYITLVDSTASVAVITGGQTLTLTDAFKFIVASDVPDNHPFVLTLHVQTQEQSFQRFLELVAHAPVLRVIETRLNDGDNGMIDPGETADLLVTYKNDGSAKVSALNFEMTPGDTNIIVNNGMASVPLLKPDSTCTVKYNVTGNNSAPFQHIFPLNCAISANNNFSANDTLFLFSGQIVEDFETANFEKFPWLSTGQAPWLIEPSVKYEGDYSARSGWLGDNMESCLNLSVNVLAEGPVSFYKYVSCEHDPSGNNGYDYLVFVVDGYELARWDGEITWSKETFWLSAGYHTLAWIYHKDYSVAAGWDGCLVDFITFPLIEGAIPVISANPLSIDETLNPGESVTRNVTISNLGGGILNYSVIVFDTTANKKELTADHLAGSAMTCSVEEFTPGQTIFWVLTVVNHSTDNEYIREIKLDLPSGLTVETATNFAGGSLGELIFTGVPGNGTSLNWHGESAGGLGVLKPGETAYATITGTIGESFMNDVFMVYDLRGDSSGLIPHHQAGHVRVKNNGLANSWVTVVNAAGSLMHNQSDSAQVTLSAGSLASGIYRCDLIVRDLYNNKIVIPVTMNIPFPVGAYEYAPSTGRIYDAYPNPFAGETRMAYDLHTPSAVTVEIYSREGVMVRKWQFAYQAAGHHTLVWDGADMNGNKVAPGLYVSRFSSEDFSGTFKLILIR